MKTPNKVKILIDAAKCSMLAHDAIAALMPNTEDKAEYACLAMAAKFLQEGTDITLEVLEHNGIRFDNGDFFAKVDSLVEDLDKKDDEKSDGQ